MIKHTSTPHCVCSTVGFDSAQWDDYYPEECPDDWKIAYFMNDFQAVYLTPKMWFNNAELIASVADEIEGVFDLVVELPSAISMDNIQATLDQLNVLNPHIACLVLNIDSINNIEPIIEFIQAQYDVSLTQQNNDSTLILSLAKRYKTKLVWYFDQTIEIPNASGYQVIILPCLELRVMRAFIEQTKLACTEKNQTGIFIEASRKSTEFALQSRTLIELLGI